MTLIRHIPPCDDPDCMPCWWDALDREMFPLPPEEQPLTFTQRLRKALWEFFHALDGVSVRWKPFAIRHDPPRWEDR